MTERSRRGAPPVLSFPPFPSQRLSRSRRRKCAPSCVGQRRCPLPAVERGSVVATASRASQKFGSDSRLCSARAFFFPLKARARFQFLLESQIRQGKGGPMRRKVFLHLVVTFPFAPSIQKSVVFLAGLLRKRVVERASSHELSSANLGPQHPNDKIRKKIRVVTHHLLRTKIIK